MPDGNPKGCITRIWCSDEEFLTWIGEQWKPDFGSFEVSPVPLQAKTGHATKFMLYMTRMGNLDLTGWMASVARDLDDLVTEGNVTTSVPSMQLGIELVY